jgi:outer membrane receptor for Fe3+-dicitrate
MKKITRFLLVLVVMLFTTIALSQSTLKGVVMGSDMNAPLPGANVIEKGTSNGTTSDFDGNFTLSTISSSGEIIISYVGYTSQTITFSGDLDLGVITMESSEFGLQEVQIIASVAVDRKTPVAVSTVKAADIELKLGTQEFPEILKSTPGVYTTKTGGGYGDGRINVRGFKSENVAVMINGIPVNDMENGSVYWSNWAGLADVTSSMQVQRGLGAAKIAVPSIGGTINIISRTTDIEEGGSVSASVANDGYLKYGVTYSTGLSENGFGATVSAAKTEGDGYVDGTEFSGVSYFLNLSKIINDNHKLSFTVIGAKQRHGQRENKKTIETFRINPRGIKYNADWGYKNGQVTHIEDNFYNKPQISLNHYWTINDKTTVSTSAYVGFGSGGGGGWSGEGKWGTDYRFGEFGPVDIDKIVDENIANGANGSTTILRASRNDHNWYGILSTLKTVLSDKMVLLAGLDYRNYKGIHFREVTDLLGGQYFAFDDDENNPNGTAQVGDKFSYYNDGLVGWIGAFGQLEYDVSDKFNTFASVSISNTSYKRVDYFNNLDSDPNQETDRYNFAGFQIKGGANYRLDEHHNVFANLGYFEKAPGFDAVFINFNNEDINENAENQKIQSFEIGYGYRSEKLSANLNLYSTKWKDRTETASYQQPDGSFLAANILGVNAIHQGIELDFIFKATDKLRFTGMLSLGDWRWDSDVLGVDIIDEDQNVVDTVDLYIKDLHVGDAAQTTMALGLNYSLTPRTNFVLDYNYFDNLYADFDPSDRGTPGSDTWVAPSYGTFDVILSHSFDMGPFDANLTGRINNLFDTDFIADSLDGSGSVAETALVYYGFGRTFSVGASFKF